MNEALSNIIDRFKQKKILVIGDAILDTYVEGAPDRVSREAPVMVFNVNEQKHQCGGAANTAINVAALGAETYFLSVLGKDASSREMLDILKKHQVITSYVLRDRTRTTIAKKRILSAGHQLMRIDEGTTTNISANCEKELCDAIEALWPQIDAIIVSDYDYGIHTTTLINHLATLLKSQPKLLIADARNLSKFKALHPTAVKPNYEETLKLLQLERSGDRVDQILQHAEQLHTETGANKVAVTLDADGVLLLEGGRHYRVNTIPQDNKKAIGAGDTFTSALTLSLASNASGELAAEIATAAAEVVIQKEGTGFCTNTELKMHFNSVPKLVATTAQLTTLIADLKKQGKKVVFTNGCFDIIHKGHINLLKKAREAGDVLLVGVNTDESIKQLKGADRPINNLEDRLTVLAGFESVDYLVTFAETSPVHLIKTIHPDVFVKGGTYTETSLPEAGLLKKLGCQLKIVPYVQDHSTTQLINKIQHIKPAEALAGFAAV